MADPMIAVEARRPASMARSIGVLAPLLGFRMRRIHNHLTRSFSARLGDQALRPGGFSALGLMSANPGMSQKMLSDELGQDKATVVALLDELEQRGWAERRRDAADRRRHHLFITDAGRAALTWMAGEAVANERGVVAALSDEEARLLLELLDKVYRGAFPPDA